MPINYDPLQEGDKLDAASLNDRFAETGGAGQGVNNLSQSDLERKALRQEHLPRIVTASDFPNGLTKLSPSGAAVSAGYINRLNDWTGATFTVPVPDYQTFDLSAPNGPYGPPTGVHPANRGWRIIADTNVAADAAEIAFGPLTASTASNLIGNYTGLLVKLGVEADSFISGFLSPTYAATPAVVIAIGWEDNLGNRNVVEKSIRWFNSFTAVKASLDTFTFIEAEDIGNGNQISKVFGVIASGIWGDNSNGYRPHTIRYYNIHVTPIRSGEI